MQHKPNNPNPSKHCKGGIIITILYQTKENLNIISYHHLSLIGKMKKRSLKAGLKKCSRGHLHSSLLILLIAFAYTPIFSQYFIHRTVTSADGLPSDYVNHFFQDKHGYMWISTDKGVCKFDGKNFRKITVDDGLPSNFITSAHQDLNGDMWFGSFSDNPLTHYSPKGPINYTIGHKGIRQIFFDSRNRIYLSDEKKFICLQQPLPLPEVKMYFIQALQISKDSFLVMYPGKLYLIDVSEDKPHVYEMPFDTEKGYGRIFISGKEVYILGSQLMKIEIGLQPFPWKVKVIDTGNFRNSSAVITDSSVIFGSYKGLFEYSFTQRKIKNINHKFDLPEIGINDLFYDKQGNLWIATHGKGILICPANPVCITVHEDDRIVGIAASEYEVAVATVSELLWWKPGKIAPVAKNGFFQHSGLYYIDGFWWLSDYQFLYGPSKNLRDLYKYPSINIPNGISSFWINSNQNEYIATYAEGIIRRKNGKIIDTLTITDGLCSNTIEKIIAIPDGIAALSYSNGFSIIGPGDAIKNFDRKSGLLSNMVHAIGQQGDTLLVGVEGGLSFLVRGKWVHDEKLDESTTGDRILAFFTDKQGRQFLLTNKTLCLRKGLKIIPLRSLKIITREYDIITCCFYQQESDILFIGTNRGIVNLPLFKVFPDSIVPQLVLEKVNNQSNDPSRPQKISLNGLKNSISFQFRAQTFLSGLTPQIHVRLRGFDSTFRVLNGNYNLNYQNIPPGTYSLEAYIKNGDGFRSKLQNVYKLTIKPNWWRTLWFSVLVIATSAIFSAWLVWRYQQKKYQNKLSILKLKEEQQLQRERIRRDLHDNIGSQLSYMVAQLDWMEQNANTYTKAKMQQSLGNLGENARNVVNELRESMWSLKFDIITFEMLTQRMLQILQKIQPHAGDTDISFQSHVKGEIPISPHVALNILRIFQESVNNSVKHAHAKEIKIELLQFDPQIIKLEITDDGIGFEKSEVMHSDNYGLEIMERRAAESNIALQIISEKGFGTSVIVEIKI